MPRTGGEPRVSIRERQRVLWQAPDNVSALHWLALAYMDVGELDNARDLLEGKRATFEQNALWRLSWAGGSGMSPRLARIGDDPRVRQILQSVDARAARRIT